jgi:hypothetical protein
MATLKIREVITGTNTTTDGGTAKTIATFDVSTAGPGGTPLLNCSIFITARCSGYNSVDNTAAGEWIGGCFKVVNGTLSQVGSTNHAITMIKDTGGAPNSDLSNALSQIIYFVTGVAGKTIDWFGGMEVFVYQPT